MAIEDAVVLARCLLETAELGAALAHYERRRFARTTHMVKSSWQLGRLAQLENPVLRWGRDLMLKSTPKSVIAKQMRQNATFEA